MKVNPTLAPAGPGFAYPQSTSGKRAGKAVATAMYLTALPGSLLLGRLQYENMTRLNPELKEMMPEILKNLPKSAIIGGIIIGSVIALSVFRAIGGAIGKIFDKKQDAMNPHNIVLKG